MIEKCNRRLWNIKNPMQKLMLIDSLNPPDDQRVNFWWFYPRIFSEGDFRHVNWTMNAALWDGHVESFEQEDFDDGDEHEKKTKLFW